MFSKTTRPPFSFSPRKWVFSMRAPIGWAHLSVRGWRQVNFDELSLDEVSIRQHVVQRDVAVKFWRSIGHPVIKVLSRGLFVSTNFSLHVWQSQLRVRADKHLCCQAITAPSARYRIVPIDDETADFVIVHLSLCQNFELDRQSAFR